MIKILKPFHYSFTRKYWQNSSSVEYQTLNFLIDPLDLSKQQLGVEELTVLICSQIEPVKLMQLYNRYKQFYNEKHILLTFKCTAKITHANAIPQNDQEFFQTYKEMIRVFNQFIPKLNNLDLADYLYWFKRVALDHGSQIYIKDVDQKKLLAQIQRFLDERRFLPRQLHMIYECQDIIKGGRDLLTQDFIDEMFYNNEISSTQMMQFFLTLTRRFYKYKILDLISLLKYIRKSQSIKSEFDLDQMANMYKNYRSLKVHYLVCEKQHMQFIEQLDQQILNNIKFLESGPLINIFLIIKYLPKNSNMLLFEKIHELMMDKLKNEKIHLDLDFVIAYLIKIQELELEKITKEDKQYIVNYILQKFIQDPINEQVDLMAHHLYELKIYNKQFEQILIFYLDSLISNEQIQLSEFTQILEYLHNICETNILQYLKVINQKLMKYNTPISRMINIRLQILFHYYNMVLPQNYVDLFYKQNTQLILTSLGQQQYLPPPFKKVFEEKLEQFVGDVKSQSKIANFSSQLKQIVIDSKSAISLANWILGLKAHAQQYMLPFLLNQSEGNDYNEFKAQFFLILFKRNLKIFDFNVILLGLIYCEKLLENMSKLDYTIVIDLLKHSYELDQGYSTSVFIQIVEQTIPELLEKINIQDILIECYQQQQDGYDCQLILLMMKYKCLPIQDSLQIYSKLINFTSNELRLLMLYLAMSQNIGLEKLMPMIQNQFQKVNDTYIIQID